LGRWSDGVNLLFFPRLCAKTKNSTGKKEKRQQNISNKKQPKNANAKILLNLFLFLIFLVFIFLKETLAM
jgi:hypothetical protein